MSLLVPVLLAVNPVPVGSFVPFNLPPRPVNATLESELGPVETFDPVGRAILLARDLPRTWSGTYRSFSAGGDATPVELRLDSVTAMGQMVDLRGQLTVGGQSVPVQGNLNAKSDQLDLLVLCNCDVGVLEAGGEFSGVQGMELSGWVAPRLSNPGGRLDLRPSAAPGSAPSSGSGAPVRGLW
jgi:hypothetical protein